MGLRIHVLGASGSGTSTLARNLAKAFDSQCFDTDDFFWLPTDPPFRDKRPIEARLALMDQLFLPRGDWILSGSFAGWGDPIIPRLTHVIFLSMPTGPRLARLRKRERLRAGATHLKTAEARAAQKAFLEWAAGYDDAEFTGRSRARHEVWLAALACPVVRIDASRPEAEVLGEAIRCLDPGRADPKVARA